MKSTLFSIIILLIFSDLSAQTQIYQGNSTSYSDCLLTIDGQKVYQGNSSSYSDCLATVDGIIKYHVIAVLIGPY